MFTKLQNIKDRYDFLTDQLSKSEVISDNALWKKYVKEHASLTDVVNCFDQYVKVEKEYNDALEMLSLETDKEMLTLLQEDANASKETLATLKEQLKVLLLPKDPNDDKNVIVEIRGGAGGDEAALFANELRRMYYMFADKNRWKVDEIDVNETELGGLKECTFMVIGNGAYSRFKYEGGVHRVQRVPETESQGRIHTSTVTVAILPEAVDVDIEINEKDLKVDTYRSSGAGGQHVNKTESAIRITHIPTGIVVSCQTQRSQIQNREQAMLMLKSKLAEIKEREQLAEVQEIKGEIKKIEWGSQIRSYVFCPYTLVKDHRTGFENSNIVDVMDGNLQPFIEDYLTKAQ